MKPHSSPHSSDDTGQRPQPASASHPAYDGSPIEQALKAVLDRSPTAVALFDDSGHIIYANRMHRGLFGELTGQGPALTVYDARLAEVTNENPHWDHVFTPILTDSGQLTASILFDQTRLKQAEEAYRVLVENSLQGLVIVTLEEVTFVNSTIEQMLGYTREELLALTFRELIGTLIHPDDAGRLLGYASQRFEGASPPNHYECRCLHRNGEVLWIELFVSMIRYGGQPAIQAALVNITDRKQAARALEERERQFKTLAEHSPDLIVRIDRDMIVRYANSAFDAAFKIKPDMQVKDLLLSFDGMRGDADQWEQDIAEIFHTDRPRTICTQISTRRGIRYFHIHMIPERGVEGDVESVLSIGRDITDIHDAEEALKHTEASLREAQRLARIGSWELQVDSGTLYLSEMIYEILGIPPETIPPLFSHFRRFLHPADRNVFRQVNEFFRNAAPSFSLEHRIVRPDGDIRWIHQRAMAVEYLNSRPVRLVGSMQDITERKEAEEAVRRSEEKYRDLVENISDVLFVVDKHDTLSYISSSVTPLFDYLPEEVIGASFWSFVAPQDLPLARQAYEALSSGEDLTIDLRIISRSGDPVWVSTSIRPILESGIPSGFRGTVTDITVRKQAEEYRRYKELFEYVADGVFILDDTLRFRQVSDRLAAKTGYSRDELLGTSLLYLVPGGDQDSIEPLRNIISSNTEGHCELEFLTASGVTKLLDLSVRPIHYQGTLCYLCISRDITETAALRDKLMLSERLAATGQLAASIAHEINSPLQAITIMLSIMAGQFPEEEEHQENIRLLRGAFDNISEIVKNLLDLNRPGSQRFQPTDINRVIEQSATLIQAALTRQKIVLNLRLSPDIPNVNASPQQLSQVIINLINNAAEAIGGQVSDDIDTPDADTRREIAIRSRYAGDSVIFRVSDTGPGIDPDAISHIFEPFYTRKKRMGIGIGLSVCHSIIKTHDGTLSARNRPSGGAVFTVILPAS